MQLYGLRTCDTCRTALKALPGVTLVDVRAEGLPEDVLDRAIACFGPALVNRRSTTWLGLDEATRTQPIATLLRANPAVMKRPLIDDGTTLHLGWSAQTRAALGL